LALKWPNTIFTFRNTEFPISPIDFEFPAPGVDAWALSSILIAWALPAQFNNERQRLADVQASVQVGVIGISL
jgi:hypothetical protein